MWKKLIKCVAIVQWSLPSLSVISRTCKCDKILFSLRKPPSYTQKLVFDPVFVLSWEGKVRFKFNFTNICRYIDDVLSINIPDFKNYLSQMYPTKLEIEDTTKSNTSASYFSLHYLIGKTVNFELPLTTSVTISISISHQFLRSIIPFRPPMVFSFTSPPIRQDLLLSWMLYSMGYATFQ